MPEHLDDADLVETRYKGSHIPSKAFRALQMYIKDDENVPSKGIIAQSLKWHECLNITCFLYILGQALNTGLL